MKKITIDRSKWRRGGDNQKDAGETQLLNEQGFMCCLGFICNQAGIDSSDLLEVGEPCDIPWAYIKQEHLIDFPIPDLIELEPTYFDSGEFFLYDVSTLPVVFDAIEINDSENIPDQKRETLLKVLFEGIYDLEFVDGEANEAT